MDSTFRYQIDSILEEWRRLKEDADREGERINFSKEGLTLIYEPMSGRDALRLIESGEYEKLPEYRKKVVLAKMKDEFDRAEAYWNSSSSCWDSSSSNC